MPKHLWDELQNLIDAWRLEYNKSVKEIASLAKCSERTVYSILSYNRDYGLISNPHARARGRHCSLETSDVNFILALLDASPSLYLNEIQERLLDVRDAEVSIATLCQSLRRAAVSRKKVSKHALERNELL